MKLSFDCFPLGPTEKFVRLSLWCWFPWFPIFLRLLTIYCLSLFEFNFHFSIFPTTTRYPLYVPHFSAHERWWKFMKNQKLNWKSVWKGNFAQVSIKRKGKLYQWRWTTRKKKFINNNNLNNNEGKWLKIYINSRELSSIFNIQDFQCHPPNQNIIIRSQPNHFCTSVATLWGLISS